MFTKTTNRAMEWANEIITRYEGTPLVELPRGVRGIAKSCPLATGIKSGIGSGVEVSVQLWDYSIRVGGVEVERSKTPWRVRRFIAAFDSGNVRHLDLEKAQRQAANEKRANDAAAVRLQITERNRTKKIDSLEQALAATPVLEPPPTFDVYAPTAMV
jgi:hypothetical protein